MLMESREHVCVFYVYGGMIETSWGSVPVNVSNELCLGWSVCMCACLVTAAQQDPAVPDRLRGD